MVLPDQSQLLEWLVVATSNFLLQEFLDDPQIGMLPVERHLYLHYIVGSRGGFDKVGYHGTSLVKQQLDLKTLGHRLHRLPIGLEAKLPLIGLLVELRGSHHDFAG